LWLRYIRHHSILYFSFLFLFTNHLLLYYAILLPFDTLLVFKLFSLIFLFYEHIY
jgi:hypothetical protein